MDISRIRLIRDDVSIWLVYAGNSISSVKQVIDQSSDASAQPRILGSMRQLGERTETVLGRLYVRASLKKPQAH